MITLASLTSSQLKRAAAIKDQISALEKELASILGSSTPAPVKAKKSGMSAAARAKISKAAKARWAKIKASGKKSL